MAFASRGTTGGPIRSNSVMVRIGDFFTSSGERKRKRAETRAAKRIDRRIVRWVKGNSDPTLVEDINKHLEGEERAKVLFSDIVFESDPKKVIQKYFELGHKMIETQEMADFWKLQYKIKWELEIYGEQKMEPLELALTNAFSKLGYESPEFEARLLLVTLDGMATRFFLQKSFNLADIMEFLQNRYKL